MDSIRYLLVAFFLFSSSVFADEYPATKKHYGEGMALFDSAGEACDSYSSSVASGYGAKFCGQMQISGTTSGGLPNCQRYLRPDLDPNSQCNWYDHAPINYKYECPSGGTLSGSICINAPECQGGGQRDANGECGPPPPNCTSGDQKTITEFQSSGNTNVYIGRGPDMSSGGCQYQCSSDTESDVFYYTDQGTYYPRLCVGTGNPAVPGDTAGTAVPSGAIPVARDIDDGQTCQSLTHHRVCTGGDIPPNCFEVDGLRSCQVESTEDSTVYNNDPPEITPSSDDNCYRTPRGSVSCVVTESDSVKQYCGKYNGQTTCYSDDKAVTRDTTTTTTTNPDGSITKTVTTSDNIRNSDGSTTITTTYPDGHTETTKTGGNGPSSGTGESGEGVDNGTLNQIAKNTDEIAKNTSKSECEKSPNSIGCSDLSEGAVPAPGQIATIDVPIALQYTSWGEGSCPSPQSISLHGISVDISYQPYCDIASGIRPILIALAFMSAAYIVFGGVKE